MQLNLILLQQLLQDLMFHISPRLWLSLSAHKTLVYNVRVSQGSVATRVRCGGIFDDSFIANCPQSVPVKEIVKICQYLAEICKKVWWRVFDGSRCSFSANICSSESV